MLSILSLSTKDIKLLLKVKLGIKIYVFKNQRNFLYILSEGSCEVMKNIDIEIK
jgi:hypothetical protein